jgi:CheY-like chemotaxis protein
MRVLAVDDDSSSRYLFKTILEARGHTVTLAENGEVALEVAAAEPPDLIVTDILMPTMDGYQLCMRWRSISRLARIPLVFYTATYTDEADEAFAKSIGADAFLRKPLDAPNLVRALEDAAERGARDLGGFSSTEHELEVLRQYSERLVNKLEQKASALQQSNTELRTALELLSDEIAVKDTLIARLNAELERCRRD